MHTENLTMNAPTIGELVSQDWRRAEIFKKYGIDYCCGGKRTVADACKTKGINPALVEADLEQLESSPSDTRHDYSRWELDFLADYIVNNHHRYVNGAIPFIDELSKKVARVHGDNHPELWEIARQAQVVINELNRHMPKEEIILFPYIKEMVQAKKNNTPLSTPPFGTIVNPIRMMEEEHTSAGSALEAIAELSNRFTPPADACMSFSVLFAKLQEFQQDLHQHIHLENNILFPKAIQLEAELFSRSC